MVAELRLHEIRTAHYVGMADEGLIRALKAELGAGLTIMDYFDRWSGGARFFADEDDPPLPPCPDWMEDVVCYHEGCPDAEMLVFDLRGMDAMRLLRELLEAPHHREPFRRVAVIGPAGEWCGGMRGYRWDEPGRFRIGTATSAPATTRRIDLGKLRPETEN